MAEALAEVAHNDDIWMPYAIEVDGQIVTMYDPNVHQRSNRVFTDDADPRWVLCRRPRVLVGGELTIDMLDLQYNQSARFYSAPVQLKANNGVLIIDDFGRQRVNPDQLLNRWVVPLDRQIDFLTLAGGKKIEVPFDVVVVFATNIDPSKLVDEAFLRRIQTKIKADVITANQFHQIFQRVCEEFSLEYTKEAVDCVIYMIENEFKEPLRPCHPRDIVQQIVWAARYEGTQARLDTGSIVQACRNYFLTSAAS
jgi:predicted ATPase with chaperone activity